MQTRGYTLEQLAAVFGDETVDDQGKVHNYDVEKKEKDLEVEIKRYAF